MSACFFSTCPLVPCISVQTPWSHVSSQVCESASFAVLIVRVVLFVTVRCLKLVLVFGALIVFFGGLVKHVC